jgi:hypothetical protein
MPSSPFLPAILAGLIIDVILFSAHFELPFFKAFITWSFSLFISFHNYSDPFLKSLLPSGEGKDEAIKWRGLNNYISSA